MIAGQFHVTSDQAERPGEVEEGHLRPRCLQLGSRCIRVFCSIEMLCMESRIEFGIPLSGSPVQRTKLLPKE